MEIKENLTKHELAELAHVFNPTITFDEYQERALPSAIYPHEIPQNLSGVMYCTLGLTGEAGEVAEKVKKLVRDGDTPEKRKAIIKEIGDVLWYVSNLLRELGGFKMSQAAEENLTKVLSRKQRGTLHGDGDDR
jgi:NTP pyrophosphatase (non-canonical NTP hydrolase)